MTNNNLPDTEPQVSQGEETSNVHPSNVVHPCAMCPAQFTHYGHNPYPLAETGRCCNDCQSLRVLPARFMELIDAMLEGNVAFHQTSPSST